MDDNALDLLEAAKDTLFAIFKGDPYATNNAAVMRNRIDVFLQHRQIDRLAASPPHNDGQEDAARADENFASYERVKALYSDRQNECDVYKAALQKIVDYVAVNEVASAPPWPLAPGKMKAIARAALAASPPHNDGQEDVVLDKARLDSGLIRIEDRDEFGEPIGRLFVGLNLREAIDKGREEAT